jgi:hypothetical protein
MIKPSRMNAPRQNTFSAITSAWRLVVGWNQKFPDVRGIIMFPPFKRRNLWCGRPTTNEIIGQSFPRQSVAQENSAPSFAGLFCSHGLYSWGLSLRALQLGSFALLNNLQVERIQYARPHVGLRCWLQAGVLGALSQRGLWSSCAGDRPNMRLAEGYSESIGIGLEGETQKRRERVGA